MGRAPILLETNTKVRNKLFIPGASLDVEYESEVSIKHRLFSKTFFFSLSESKEVNRGS